MRSVRFLQDRVVDDCRKGTPDEERYEAGQVYQLSARSAERWVNRGLAQYVKAEVAAAEQASPPVSAEVKSAATLTPAPRQGMPRAKPTA